MTSAPKSERMVAAAGPAIQLAQSTTFRSAKRCSVIQRCPRQGLVDAGKGERAGRAGAGQALGGVGGDLRRSPVVFERCALDRCGSKPAVPSLAGYRRGSLPWPPAMAAPGLEGLRRWDAAVLAC